MYGRSTPAQLAGSWCRLRAALQPWNRLRHSGADGLAPSRSPCGTAKLRVTEGLLGSARCLHMSAAVCDRPGGGTRSTQLVTQSIFDQAKEKNKKTYLAAMDMFHEMTVHKRGHVEFIYAALAEMESYGVHKDIEAYRKVLGVFPVGQMVATNMWQVEFMHYPRQQNCAIDVLQQMEDNGVIPDLQMRDQLINIFGKFSFPVRKLARMLYWMPKFKNMSPWLLPKPLPSELHRLAELGIAQITSVDTRSEVVTFQADELPEEALDRTWIVSGQSEPQRSLLEQLPTDQPLQVEGPYTLWLKDQSIGYFVLKAEPEKRPRHEGLDCDDITFLENWTWRHGGAASAALAAAQPPSVHQQEDATILAICATGTSSRDSLLSWVRLLQLRCPRLAELPVLFTLRAPSTDVATTDGADASNVTPADGVR